MFEKKLFSTQTPVKLTISEAERNREIIRRHFDTFIEKITPFLLDESQSEILSDAKFSILGGYDAEISFADNCIRIEKEMRKQKIANLYLIKSN